MIYEAACAFLGRAPMWRPPTPCRRFPPSVRSPAHGEDVVCALDAVAAGYDPTPTTPRCARSSPARPTRAAAFRRYRENYPERRELARRAVALSLPLPGAIPMLNRYGTRVEPLSPAIFSRLPSCYLRFRGRAAAGASGGNR